MAEMSKGEARGEQPNAGDEEADELQAEQESAEAMDADVPHESEDAGTRRSA
ncbi:MAG TPA: hypothetical protein VFA21_16640 [Pyrinomonadaceae bacterium]|jgi:hypothetical protein|nr:hypothetical protein [Pyrinomonadaceae bacterium]